MIPGQETEVPHVAGQLRPPAATTEPKHSRAHALQLERPHAATKDPAWCKKGRSRVPQPRPDTAKLKKKKNKTIWGHFPSGPVVKNLPANAGDTDTIPGL